MGRSTKLCSGGLSERPLRWMSVPSGGFSGFRSESSWPRVWESPSESCSCKEEIRARPVRESKALGHDASLGVVGSESSGKGFHSQSRRSIWRLRGGCVAWGAGQPESRQWKEMFKPTAFKALTEKAQAAGWHALFQDSSRLLQLSLAKVQKPDPGHQSPDSTLLTTSWRGLSSDACDNPYRDVASGYFSLLQETVLGVFGSLSPAMIRSSFY